MPLWARIDGYDPVAAAAVTLRACSHDDPATCNIASAEWYPALAKLPTLRYDLFDGDFSGKIVAPSSSLTLRVELWPNFARYALADARIRLYTDPTVSPIFDGRITAQPKIESGAASIDFAVDDRWLDTALLATYAGTTGAEGPAAMKGQVKPLALGAPRYVPGKLIDSLDNVFQISAYGAINAVEAALERLARLSGPVADYASYAALVAASIPNGKWATAKAVGMVRFGAPTTGQVSFLAQGDAAGPDGWARKPGQLIRRIALLSGGTGKIDDTSLNALDAARPYNLSIYVDEQTTARELIQNLAASINAVAGVSWTGKLFVVPVAIGTASVTLAADGSSLPAVNDVQQIDIAPPFAKLAIGAERTWQVHALGDIAFTASLVDMGDYASGTTYREGNIVQDQGSTWLYLNTTASAGNAPPTLPATSNSWWKVLAKQGADGAPGAPGTAGAPGAPGADGQTLYAWIAYADSADGSVNFTTGTPGTRGYQGLAFNKATSTESTNPADYVWLPYRGPAMFGLVAQANVAVGPDYVVKTGTASNWDASAYSSEGYVGGVTAGFTATGSDYYILGLNTDPTVTPYFGKIDYGFYLENEGAFYAHESGSNIHLGAYAVGDTFRIVYDNQKVTYYRNGTIVRQVSAASNLRFFLDTLFYSPGERVSGIKFFPTGSAGANGSPGSNGAPGRDAVVYLQDSTPTSPVTGDTWATVTPPRMWKRWNGSSWVQILGDLSSLDAIIAGNLVTDGGLDLRGVVPGSLNWRANMSSSTAYSAENWDTGIIAISASGTVTTSSIITLSGSATYSTTSGGDPASAGYDIYYRINGGSWVLAAGRTQSPFYSFSGLITLSLDGSTFSPAAAGTMQLGYRAYGAAPPGYSVSSYLRSVTAAVVNWK